MPSHSKFKASGVEWLGNVPAHWEVRPFKTVFQERSERSASGEELLLSVSAYTGITPRSDLIDSGDHLTRAESLEGYKVCFANDLVMNIMLAWNRGLGITKHNGIVSPAYCVFKICSKDEPDFLDYLVRSDEYIRYFKAFSSGVIDSRLRLYPDTFGRLACALPPVVEQKEIAAFLDRETAKIDGLVAEQRRLIELLTEKRQAVISHAVTKGLNHAARLKPSGIEWLGEIPVHWQVRRVKDLCSMTTSGPRGWSEMVGDEGKLFIQSGDLDDALNIRYETAKRVQVGEDAETARTRLAIGDILVCITGAKTGNVAVCRYLDEPGFINQHICLIRPKEDIQSMFLGYALKSRGGQAYLEQAQYGLKQGLSLEDVRLASIALPPRSEQKEIVAFISRQFTAINELVEQAEKAAGLLLERRASLISNVVTGQLSTRSNDVRLVTA